MENYLLFILTAMLIIIMPGPGFALVTKILSRMVKWRDKDCFRNDIWNDDSYNNGYVRLSAILMKFAMLFTFIKYAGAVYLIYLAVKSIKSALHKKKICQVQQKWTLRILGQLKALDKDLLRQF